MESFVSHVNSHLRQRQENERQVNTGRASGQVETYFKQTAHTLGLQITGEGGQQVQ